jgi:hypothetical protein
MQDKPQTNIFRKESLERLSSPEQLDQLMHVVSPRSWLSLTALGSLTVLAVVWSLFGRIPIAVTGRGILVHPKSASSELVGLTYFQSGEGDRIQPGMEIIVVPDPVKAARIGGIVGRVESVAVSPLTTLDAVRQAATMETVPLQQQAMDYANAGLIEVLVELERDPSTVSGYRWSSVSGRQVQVSPGVTTTARITLAHKAPIAFAFPFFEAAR